MCLQVTENTAIILDECDILTTCRGETFVKGAGYIKTYFVPLDENFNLIMKENSMNYYRVQDRARYFSIRNSMYDDNLYEIRKMSYDSVGTYSYISDTGTVTPSERKTSTASEDTTRSISQTRKVTQTRNKLSINSLETNSFVTEHDISIEMKQNPSTDNELFNNKITPAIRNSSLKSEDTISYGIEPRASTSSDDANCTSDEWDSIDVKETRC